MISQGTNAHVESYLGVDNPQAEIDHIRGSAKDAVSNMQSPTKPMSLVIGTSASALEPVKEFVDNWTPLLSKVKVFCDLMDGIAEVCGHTHPDDVLLTYEPF